jgi:hypothetical protein
MDLKQADSAQRARPLSGGGASDGAHAQLMDELTRSFGLQVEAYRKLKNTVQKILSQLILSRSDVASVMPLFAEKQKLLDGISLERSRTQQAAQTWIAVKASVAPSAERDQLEATLADTEKIIREFLDAETQLQKYLEHFAKKSTPHG